MKPFYLSICTRVLINSQALKPSSRMHHYFFIIKNNITRNTSCSTECFHVVYGLKIFTMHSAVNINTVDAFTILHDKHSIASHFDPPMQNSLSPYIVFVRQEL